jgi:hypothetical protein
MGGEHRESDKGLVLRLIREQLAASAAAEAIFRATIGKVEHPLVREIVHRLEANEAEHKRILERYRQQVSEIPD